jgi:hypothetical protein
MSFDGGQRFADSGPERGRHPAESVQDVLLACGLHLFLVENVAAPAVPRPQPQDVCTSKRRDRAIKDSGAAGSLANLSTTTFRLISTRVSQPARRGIYKSRHRSTTQEILGRGTIDGEVHAFLALPR